MQAAKLEATMACECKDFGQQVGAMSLDWSDDNEPVLLSSHLPSVRTVTNASLVEWIGSA
jgi:hypothetical protein